MPLQTLQKHTPQNWRETIVGLYSNNLAYNYICVHVSIYIYEIDMYMRYIAHFKLFLKVFVNKISQLGEFRPQKSPVELVKSEISKKNAGDLGQIETSISDGMSLVYLVIRIREKFPDRKACWICET